MALKTYAEQIVESEKAAGSGHRHQVRGSSGGSGINAPLLIVGVALAVIAMFMLPQVMAQPYAVGAYSGDKAQQSTNLAYQQGQLAYSMTRDAQGEAERVAAIQAATQGEYQLQQNQVHDRETAAALPLTQTTVAREAELQDLQMQKQRDEYFYASYITPIRVFGVFALEIAVAIGLLAAAGMAFGKLLSVAQARMYVHHEQRGETLVVVKPGQTTRTDLMHRPVLTDQRNGTTVASGGAQDELVQQRVAALALAAKAIRDMPPDTKLPGLKPNVEKHLPEMEFIDGEVIDPKLLSAVKQSLDGGAEVL